MHQKLVNNHFRNLETSYLEILSFDRENYLKLGELVTHGLSSHFAIVMEIARSFTTPQIIFRGNFPVCGAQERSIKCDEKFYDIFVFFLLG